MAKRKDLLLKESTVSRMMGLAGIGALTNPFLREEKDKFGDSEHIYNGQSRQTPDDTQEEEDLEEGYHDEEEDLEEGYHDDEEEYDDEEDESGHHRSHGHHEEDECPDCGMPKDECECDEDEDDDEEDESGVMGSHMEEEYMQESVRKSMKRLKRLLEQAEADAPPPAGGKDEMPPEPAPGGGGDEMETKIKEFVKKLGELVQETLGVEVTVEEGEGEPEMPEGGEGTAPEGAAGAPPPAPLAEAISRLVNKVARRVKARLMEAQKKEKAHATHDRTHAKFAKALKLKEKQMAVKKKEMDEKKAKALKEKQVAAKKKQMEMKKKKAAMSKKK